MKRIKYWLKEIMGISRVEVNGLVILLPLICIVLFLPSIYQAINSPPDEMYASQQLDSLMASLKVDAVIMDEPVKNLHLHPFDPNAVTPEMLLQMGVNQKAADNWVKYLASGGRFKQVADVKKIYGLTTKTYNSIKSYVIIKESRAAGVRVRAPRKEEGAMVKHPKRYLVEPFDINTVDTATLKKVKGIGSTYAGRIVKYREILGGYIDLTQLSEVYGLSEGILLGLDTLAFIKNGFEPRGIDVNHWSAWEMARHPYLSKKTADVIDNYRFQHGLYSSIDDFYNINVLDSLTISKMRPYLQFVKEDQKDTN